jgi:hypothetical protein
LVYQNQVSLDISNAFDDYWSSTEFDAIYAAIEWFTGDGSVWSNDKNSLNAVRPIRAF